MSNIEWTDETWNPTRGCEPVSPGCLNCYAQRQAIRHARIGGPYEGLVHIGKRGPAWTGEGRFVGDALDKPTRWREPRRIFVDSMSDLFFKAFTDEQIAAVFGVMCSTPQHTYQVLTKRPSRAQRLLSSQDFPLAVAALGGATVWPLPQVWLGVSVEDQKRADERVPLLLETPAAVRFLSVEPLLGPVDLRRHIGPFDDGAGFIDWVIVGGESGPGARPCNVEWLRSVVAQCKAAGVPCFVKQLGAVPRGYSCASNGECTHPDCGVVDLIIRDRKGGDPDEWPVDLRVRQFPERAA